MRTLLLTLLVATISCSSKSNNNPPPSDGGAGEDTGGGGDDDAASGARVTDQGKVEDFDTKRGLAGVTVTEGDVSTTTDKDGVWTLKPLANTAVTLTFAAKDHTTLTYPEVLISGDTQRETVSALSTATLQFVGSTLAGWNKDLGVLFIGLKTLSSCADQSGATITVDAPAGSTTYYIKNGIPNSSLTSVQANEDPSIAVYNVQPNTPIQITLSHPTCKVTDFPYTDGTLTYTGKITTTGANADTYARLFLK